MPKVRFFATVRCGKSRPSWKTKPTRRLCGGTRTPDACQRSPSNVTSPTASVSRPLTIRRSVVLPEPLGPNSAVMPSRAIVSWTASAKLPRSSLTSSASSANGVSGAERHAAVDHVHGEQHEEREDEEAGRQRVRLAVLQRLDMLEDCDRDDPRFAGNAAADHQHDAELAERVREHEHHGGDVAAQR